MATRRKFIKIITGASAAVMIPIPSWGREKKTDKWGELLPLREFGKTGEKVTMLGLGGFHIGKMNDHEAEKTVETAMAGGIRFFDTAESYQRGFSEEQYGKFLTPKYRDEIFLMTKTKARDASTAREHLEGSLRRMKTGYLDLWQVHSVNSAEDVNRLYEKGMIDVFLDARAKGLAKHIGFTGHVTPAAHQRIMELSPEMETCMMPVNLLDPNYNSFIKNTLPLLLDREMGVIAMKTLAGGGFFGGGFEGRYGETVKVVDFISVQEALHFVWSLPVDVLVTGPDNSAMLQEKIDMAKSFEKLSGTRQDELIAKVAHMAGKKVEYYKD